MAIHKDESKKSKLEMLNQRE